MIYAICKNEEKFVKRWVEFMKEADNFYVLDTGSTDKTVEILEYIGDGKEKIAITANPILTAGNPEGSTTALTITASAGGTNPVSAHIVITQLI